MRRFGRSHADRSFTMPPERADSRDELPRDGAAPAFLAGGGEMGERMRAMDWSKTSLGPAHAWPQSLRSALSILLPSKAQIVLFWGSELVALYNDAYRPVFGAKHPRVLGLPAREAWSELWETGLRQLFEGVLQTGEAFWGKDLPFVLERYGYPEETFFDVSYDPVRDESGRVGGVFCIVSETTGRVVGERRLGMLRDLATRNASVQSARDACVFAAESCAACPEEVPFAQIYLPNEPGAPGGSALALVASTPGAERLVGTLNDELQADELRVLSLPEDPLAPADEPALREVALVPIPAARPDGATGVLAVGLNPLRPFDERYRSFLELVAGQVATGVASGRAHEEERRRAAALAELDRAKTTFFSNVSHEFRTPLTLMLGPLEDLLANTKGNLGSEDRALVLQVQRNGQRLLKLVNTLLDFARLEAGRAQAVYQPTELSVLTADLASTFRSACERAGLRLEVDCPPLPDAAFVDREMWEKIVLNLVSNAFKFTLEGQVTVRLRAFSDRFELTVADTGVGIPAAALPRILERFQRVEDARGRSHEGSGIGLALVHELVKLQGGTLRVESVLDEGTTFSVTLPKGHAHLPATHVKSAPAAVAATVSRAGSYVAEALGWLPDSEQPVPSPRPLTTHRVLLADDNADMREYGRRLLAEHYVVEVVADGAAALEAARVRRPDVVVSDVMMPRLDGFGLIRELRADPELQSVPVILLSARAGEEARVEGLARGADDYLVKPFSARELLVRVGSLVNSAEMYRRMNAAKAQFETLLNEAPLGLFVVDDELRIAAMNPIARRSFGDEDVIGRDLTELLRSRGPLALAEEVLAIFRHTLQTGVTHFDPERLGQGPQGVEYLEWQVSRIPLPGGRLGVVSYFRDVSKLVKAREALREADNRKDEFLATLSHELRNPLAPLRNALHLLRTAGGAVTDPAKVHDIMERQVNHLTRLVNDLLEMSRITRGQLELRRERVELAAVLRNAVETSEPLIQEARHRLELSLPEEVLWLDGDPVRLAQILSNLLNNAARYTPEGGVITLSAKRSGGMVEISVRDNGVGIARGALSRIFELFKREGRADARGQGGLGIGLTLARRLAEMHGGTLDAHSEGEGHGSEFIVRVPLGPGAREERPAASRAKALSHLRILAVDDNEDAAESMGMLLEMMGAEVRLAHDGPSALDAFGAFGPDALLLDIGMPDMDGYEVARALNARFPGHRATLVALTGWGQEEDRRRAREAGFHHHLVKPADLDALQRLLSGIRDTDATSNAVPD